MAEQGLNATAADMTTAAPVGSPATAPSPVAELPFVPPVAGAQAATLPPQTVRLRVRQRLNSLLKDHAFIRMIYKNRFRLSPRMFRSSQPTPAHIAQAARMGVRTIVNLRGRRDDCGSWVLEAQACARHGIRLVDFPVNSRDAPKKHILHRAREIWQGIDYPALMHCKAGSDRVGFMSVLYLFVHEGRPLEEALRQLDWRYGHLKQAKTGILDHFFETYLAYARAHGTAGDADDFYRWVDEVYDPVSFKQGFMTEWWANTLTDRLIRRE